MRRADGDGEIGIAGVVDGERHACGGCADRGFQGAVPGIACGDHDDDAGLDQAIDLHAKRALAARKPFGLEVITDAHVDALNQQTAAIPVDFLDVVDGGDEVAHRAFAIFIEHAQAHELAPGRHAADPFQPRFLVFDVLCVRF